MTAPKNRSLSEFDYFDDAHQPQPDAAPPEVRNNASRARAAFRRTGLLGLASMAVLGFAVYQSFDLLSYAFAEPRPLELGDVVDLNPRDLRHNAFVRLEGITEHRGLGHDLMRGLSVNRREYWLMRLVGSRGVLVLTPADRERFGFATQLEVEGRVVDPSESDTARRLVASYVDRYQPPARDQYRLVEVDYRPGDDRVTAMGLLLALAALITLNLVALLRSYRRFHLAQ